MPSRKLSAHDAAGRHAAAKRDHTYVDRAGNTRQRAWFTEEEAREAALRVYDVVSRRYGHYRCRDSRCGGWHIRPLPLKPSDMERILARSAAA